MLRRYFSTTKTFKKLAFIGLGNMGFPMLQNLIQKSSFNISVFDTNSSTLQLAQREGALISKSPKEAAINADYVITMLPGNNQVKSVITSLELKEGSTCIDCSTVDPTISAEMSEFCKTKRGNFLDAPVSGGVGGAKAGTLTFMVGGSKSSFEDVSKNVLSFMGKNVVHCGEVPGSGEIAKLCNNLILGISMAAVSESINIGVRLGVDAKVLSNIINSSSGRCWSSDTYNPYPGILPNVPSSKDYEGGFASALMLKDLNLALDAARNAGAPTPLGERCKDLYSEIVSAGLSNKDFSIVLKYLQNNKR